MKISLNEIKKLVKIPKDVDDKELIRLIGARLVEVEEVDDWSPKWAFINIVRVESCEPIPDTHLHLCMVDGGPQQGGLVQVVCGAPNVHAGMLAVWIAPGAIIPATYGNENIKIDKRKLRGYESSGMLAAADELGLGEDHGGIIEINPEMEITDEGKARKIRPGDSFADAFGLWDIILDIENKSLTHRPDCFGLVGFAREVAGILGVKFDEQAAIDYILTSPEHNAQGLKGSPNNKEQAIANHLLADTANNAQGPKSSPSNKEQAVANHLFADYAQVTTEHKRRTPATAGGADACPQKMVGQLAVSIEDVVVSNGREISRSENSLALSVEIEDAEICPRYSAAVVDFTDAPHSEYFTRDDIFLIKAGMRPISPIVDMTNRIMLMTGQPLHAFDYDKFMAVGGSDTPKIVVRTAKAGEKLELLDSKEIECDENDILITSNDVPVALAGAMGGKNTDIDEKTNRIILESATFSLYHLRKTQMKHGIFSEAITRFTKGQPAGQTLGVLEAAVYSLGVEPQEVIDCYPNPAEPTQIEVSCSDINALLGTDYSKDLIIKTLENVGLVVEQASQAGSRAHKQAVANHLLADYAQVTTEHKRRTPATAGGADACPQEMVGQLAILNVKVPYWRTDLHIKEDIIEEVGRLLGFDNIPIDYPIRPFIGATEDPMLVLKNRIRDILSDRLNAHEVLTYSFVSKNLQEKAGENSKDSYEIVNSISPELQCFRQSITPSLLEKVYENQKAGYKDFALYEINQVSKKSYGLTNEEVPVMKTNLALVVTGDYYHVKAYYSELFRQLGISNAGATNNKDGQPVELAPSMLKKFKLQGPVSYFEFALDDIVDVSLEHTTKNLRFSRFPSVSRDVTFKVKEGTTYAEVYQPLDQALAKTGLIYKLEPVSIYEPKENLEKTKNLSFHITLCSEDKTLNGSEISDIMSKVTNTTCQAAGGELI